MTKPKWQRGAVRIGETVGESLMTNVVKPHLSWSQLNTYSLCGRRYWYERVAQVPRLTGSALYFGARVHEALEANYRQKIKSDQDESTERLADLFTSLYEKQLTDQEITLNFNETHDKLKATGRAVITEHMRVLAPEIHPIAVEEPWSISLGDDFPYTLSGIFDIIERDGTISDHKHYKRFKSQDDVDADGQLTMYALAYRVKYQSIEKGLAFNVVTKSSRPEARRFLTTRTEQQIKWLLGQLEAVGYAIKAGVFIPNTNGWWCSAKWCDFWHDCQEAMNPLWKQIGE